jgi:drug/metabolite transporter (DMT)-like permease
MARRYVVMLGLLAAMWGASYLLIKVAVGHMTPAEILWSRVAVGAAVIAPVVLRKHGLRETVRYLVHGWWRLLILGVLSMVWTTLAVAWSEHRLDTSLVAVIQAGSPLFLAVIAPFIAPEESSSGLRLFGLLVGFTGVALVVGVQPQGDLFAGIVVATTGVGLALNVVLALRWRERFPPEITALGYLVATTVAVLPWFAFRPPDGFPGWGPVAAMAALGLSSGAGSLLYFAIAFGAGASRVLLLQYLVPSVAVLYGALFLSEGIRATTLAGLVVVLVGVTIAGNIGRLPRFARSRGALE